MEIGKIRLEGIEVLAVEEIHMEAAVNQHAKLELVCLIKKEQMPSCVMLPERESMMAVWEQDTVLFCGMVTRAVCKTKKDGTRLYLTLLNASYLLDREKKSKSYQDLSMTFQQIAQEKTMTLYAGEDKAIEQLVIQYEETDWEFLTRMSSKLYTGVYADMRQRECVLYWGIDDTQAINKEPITEYIVEKDIEYYKNCEKNTTHDHTMLDSTLYSFESEELFRVGDAVMVGEQKVYIIEMQGDMEQATWKGRYQAKTRAGICYLPKLRWDIPGTALEGTVIDVSKDQVKVHLAIDKIQDKENAYWFPFSAMEASADGSGWYYMPEVGDCVKVCIPSWEEKEAFAVSAVSTYEGTGGEADLMENTDVMYMRNPSGKQMQLSPKQIQADAGGGKALFVMDNEGNIDLYAEQMVSMNATEMIELIAGDTLDICAAQTLQVKADMTGEIMMNESGEIQHLGGHVNINSEE